MNLPLRGKGVRLGRSVSRIGGVAIALLGLLAILAVVSPSSLRPEHLMNVLRQAAPLGIAAIGQTVVLITAGIDLSVGAIITLTNILAARYMADGSILLPVLLCLGAGAAVGLLNGLGVALLRVPPLIMTLGMSSLLTGVAFVWTRGVPVGRVPPSFRTIAVGWMGDVLPYAVLLWVGVWILFALVLYKTVLGRWIFAAGGNSRAAHASGVPTRGAIVIAYAFSGVTASIAGLILSAYVGVASLTIGGHYTLDTLAVTILGGTSFAGGEGTLAGTFLGAAALLLIQSILLQLNAGEAGRLVVQGGLIILMLALYQRRRR